MANSFSFRHGQRDAQKFDCISATVIEIGDMCWLDSDDVKPASAFAWDSDLITTQAAFAAKFCGIAMEKSASGDTDEIDIDVSTRSVYEMTCASAAYENGDPMGPDEGSSLLEDQVLEAAIATLSIARVHRREASAVTKVLVQFASAYNTASANTNATLG